MRATCPAWELKVGYLCWFINGRICQGKPQRELGKKNASMQEMPGVYFFYETLGPPFGGQIRKGERKEDKV